MMIWTYKPASPNTSARAIFWSFGKFRDFMMGSGSTAMAISVIIFIDAFVNLQSFVSERKRNRIGDGVLLTIQPYD